MKAPSLYRQLPRPASPGPKLSPSRRQKLYYKKSPTRRLSQKLRNAFCRPSRSRISKLKRIFIWSYIIFCLLFIGIASYAINSVVSNWINVQIKESFSRIEDNHHAVSAAIYRDVAFFEIDQVSHAIEQNALFFQYVKHLSSSERAYTTNSFKTKVDNQNSNTLYFLEDMLLQSACYNPSSSSLSTCELSYRTNSVLPTGVTSSNEACPAQFLLSSTPQNCSTGAEAASNYYKQSWTLGWFTGETYSQVQTNTTALESILNVFNIRSLLNATISTLRVSEYGYIPRANRITFYDQKLHLEAQFPASLDCWRASNDNSFKFKESTGYRCRGDGQVLQQVAVQQIPNCGTIYDYSCDTAFSGARCSYLASSRDQDLYFTSPHVLSNGKFGVSPCYIFYDSSDFSNQQALCLDFQISEDRSGVPIYDVYGDKKPMIVTKSAQLTNSMLYDYSVISHQNLMPSELYYNCISGQAQQSKNLALAQFPQGCTSSNCENFISQYSQNFHQFTTLTEVSEVSFDYCGKDDPCSADTDVQNYRIFVPVHSMYGLSQQAGLNVTEQLVLAAMRITRSTFEVQYNDFKEPIWIFSYVLYFGSFLGVLILAFILILTLMNCLMQRVTRPIKRVIKSMEGIMNGRKMTLEPKYFTAACTQIRELLNFLDQLLIAKRIIDRGLEGGSSETPQNSASAQNLNLLEIARVRRMYSTSNNLTSASICDVLLGILYSRLGSFHIASEMFHKSTIDIAELQSSHSKIPRLQMVSRLINMGFAQLLHVFSLKDPEIEEINRLKTHFYDLEQRVRGVRLLSPYLQLLKILLEIEADELGRAEDHLKRFWEKLAELLGYKGEEEALENDESQLTLTNNPLIKLSSKLQLVRSPYLIKQLFYYATGRLLMKEFKKKSSRFTKMKKAVRALKYLISSFTHTPVLCPFFTRRALKDAKETAYYLSRISRDTRPELIEIQRFISSIHRRVEGNRRLRFKFLVEVEDPLSNEGFQQRRSRVKAILTKLIKLLASHSNVSLVLFWHGNYACKFEELQLEKYRDNILLAIEELFKPISGQNLPQQEHYLRSNAERGTQTILDISRNRGCLRDLEKAFLGSLLKSFNCNESDPDQWLVLLVSGSHLGGVNLVRYQSNYDRYEAFAEQALTLNLRKTSLWLIDLDPLDNPLHKDAVESDPIKYLTTPHLSKLASYIVQEQPTDAEIAFAYSAAVTSFHSDPFPMIGEKF